MTETPTFYRERPIFGFDIGFNSVKLMQIENIGKKSVVTGYGVTNFDQKAVKNGVIVDPEIIAKEVYELITKNVIGEITTRRVTAAIPVSRSFNRVLSLPKMDKSDLRDAINSEAEQYIPIPIDDLYLDFEVADIAMKEEKSKEEKKDAVEEIEALVVATPRKIVDSYITLFDILGLELSAVSYTHLTLPTICSV